MAQSMVEAFQTALHTSKKKHEVIQKKLEPEVEYLELGISFIKKVSQTEVIYAISQSQWYGELVHMVPYKVRKEFEHYHAGATVFIRRADVMQILEWKFRYNMHTELLTETTTPEHNLLAATFRALYKL